ncbi:MAG: nitroreductase [Firmicutes bacterium]|nr:nitroreductase [Bacillota bacterium]
MELKEVLRARRSARQFVPKPIADGVLEEILSYAPWVPNHHVTEPWRFIVVKDHSLHELARLRYQAVLRKRQGQPTAQARAERAEREFVESAAVIVVVQAVDPDPVRRQEDYAATVMATYNIFLVAWDYGIASYWHTGPLTTDDEVRAWLGLSASETPVAFVRLGYPAQIGVSTRTPAASRTRWLR